MALIQHKCNVKRYSSSLFKKKKKGKGKKKRRLRSTIHSATQTKSGRAPPMAGISVFLFHHLGQFEENPCKEAFIRWHFCDSV